VQHTNAVLWRCVTDGKRQHVGVLAHSLKTTAKTSKFESAEAAYASAE
jgi:hypothetical protein